MDDSLLDGLTNITLPISRPSMYSSLTDIISVTPMPAPLGKVFYMDYTYDTDAKTTKMVEGKLNILINTIESYIVQEEIDGHFLMLTTKSGIRYDIKSVLTSTKVRLNTHDYKDEEFLKQCNDIYIDLKSKGY